MVASFSWTLGALAPAGWLPWLEALPLEMRARLPNGARVLCVHASPGNDDLHGIHPMTGDDELRELLRGAEADLVLVGHTHAPFERWLDGVRVVNPGSVSNPYPPDLRASYALLHAGESGCRVEFRRVDYDRQAVIDAMIARRQPSYEYVNRFMRGENPPPWLQESS
jgi:diadenosine tetraphosphatase ApaH/serine/threonine PP2A family protein phosphatase